MTNEFKERRQKNAKVNLSPEDYAAQKKAEKEAVYKMIDDTAIEVISNEENFKSFLNLQSRMNRYTTANTLLMYKQFPNASQIKDFNSWAEKEVKINKGEKAFSILDPYEYTQADGCISVGYNVKKVFDISQTDAKTRKTTLTNCDLNTIIAALVDTSPVNVEMTAQPLHDGKTVFYDSHKQTVFVKRNITDKSKLFQMLAKEIAVVQLADSKSNIDINFKAECIVYMLCKRYGIEADCNVSIPDELRRQEPKTVRAELSDIREAFNQIHDRVSYEVYRKNTERHRDTEMSR